MDEADNIDYQTINEQLMHELEEARIAILNLRRTQGMFGGVSLDAINRWVTRNYILIVVGVMLGTFIISSLQTLWKLLNTKEGDNGSRLSQ